MKLSRKFNNFGDFKEKVLNDISKTEEKLSRKFRHNFQEILSIISEISDHF